MLLMNKDKRYVWLDVCQAHLYVEMWASTRCMWLDVCQAHLYVEMWASVQCM